MTEEETLEDLLQAGVRIALEYRLDLMNDRAQLYDAWRQIQGHGECTEGISQRQPSPTRYSHPRQRPTRSAS